MTLIVLHAIPSFVGGGAERQLSMLAPALAGLGVETHVAYLHPGPNLSALLASPVQLHPLACRGNHDPRILIELLRLIRRCRPAIVQTWLPQMDILAGIAAKLTGTHFVLSERASAAAYTRGWKNRLRDVVGARANMIVANSQAGIGYWGRLDHRRRVIRNGLTLQAVRAVPLARPESLGLETDARIVLFAGRLDVQKNVETLLRALAIVLDRHTDSAAVLFGEGPLRPHLRAQMETLPTRGRMRLAGFTPELWRWMRRASAFVSVSLFEGNPNAVLEAMAIGCPLVVSAIAEHREILDDHTARFCDPTCVNDIAAAIDSVLSAPELAAQRAAAARCIADEWSIERAATAYLALYEELIDAGEPVHAVNTDRS
jgi:glycosyltransferase involved in cell wall biosynthesis